MAGSIQIVQHSTLFIPKALLAVLDNVVYALFPRPGHALIQLRCGGFFELNVWSW